MQTNSGELQSLWTQLVGLATAQGDLRAEQRNLRGRVTRVEQAQQWMLQNWPTQDTATDTQLGAEQQESLLRRIFRFRELVEAVVALAKIARALPWGTLALAAVGLWKWLYPIARDTALGFLRSWGG